MVYVSDEYKSIMDRPVRNEGQVRIVFGVSDPNAPSASTLSDNGHLYYSQINTIDMGVNVITSYDTLERGRFVLNGKNLLAQDDTTINYQGFVGDLISNDDGIFDGTLPTIVIDFGDYLTSLSGMTLSFDESMDNYPNRFSLKAYNGESLVYNEIHEPTTSKYVSEITIPLHNRLVFEFISTNIPHRRIRVQELIYGIVNTLSDGDIINCKLTVSTDMFSTELPTNKFDFTIFDVDDKYNPDNPKSLIQYLENGQSVKFSYGQTMDDGSIEWLPMYTGYSTGEVSISDTGFVKNISVKSQSLLDALDMTYNDGLYSASGISMYDLAYNIINTTGYGDALNIPDSMKSITTKTLLNGKSVKECLQLIANACGMALYVDRNGIIVIKELMTIGDVVYNFTKQSMLEAPKTNKIPEIRYLTSSYYTPIVESASKQLTSMDISTNVETDYEIFYENSTDVTYSKTSGITVIGTPVTTSNCLKMRCTGAGTINVSGKNVTYSRNTITRKINEIGVDLTMSNELINDEVRLNSFMDKVINYYSRRTDYSFENRCYPFLDIGDTVTNESNYDGVKKGTLYYNTLTYNGAITGSSKTLEFNE